MLFNSNCQPSLTVLVYIKTLRINVHLSISLNHQNLLITNYAKRLFHDKVIHFF